MILKIWNNEQIPEEWTEGIVSAIYKKGDQRLCNNYRPITLLNIVYKIFAILLHNRLCILIEHSENTKSVLGQIGQRLTIYS